MLTDNDYVPVLDIALASKVMVYPSSGCLFDVQTCFSQSPSLLCKQIVCNIPVREWSTTPSVYEVDSLIIAVVAGETIIYTSRVPVDGK